MESGGGNELDELVIQIAGCRLQVAGCRSQVAEFRLQNSDCRLQSRADNYPIVWTQV